MSDDDNTGKEIVQLALKTYDDTSFAPEGPEPLITIDFEIDPSLQQHVQEKYGSQQQGSSSSSSAAVGELVQTVVQKEIDKAWKDAKAATTAAAAAATTVVGEEGADNNNNSNNSNNNDNSQLSATASADETQIRQEQERNVGVNLAMSMKNEHRPLMWDDKEKELVITIFCGGEERGTGVCGVGEQEVRVPL